MFMPTAAEQQDQESAKTSPNALPSDFKFHPKCVRRNDHHHARSGSPRPLELITQILQVVFIRTLFAAGAFVVS